jgi:hypothetical protein
MCIIVILNLYVMKCCPPYFQNQKRQSAKEKHECPIQLPP